MQKQLTKRLLALVLAFAMVTGMAPAAFAGDRTKLTLEQVPNDVVNGFSALASRKVEAEQEIAPYGATDVVRVSIFLEEEPTIAVYSSAAADGLLAVDDDAVSYRADLQMMQEAVAEYISEEVLDGDPLDVVWNLTLATNAISANVEYGQIAAIEQIPGVASVEIETRYEPMVASEDELDPNMSTSSSMIGSGYAWAAGYTGAGSKVAVIDTGTDTDHKSFNADAFEYAIKQTGKNVDLMDADDIAAVLDQLNIADLVDDADDLYINAKLPFAFNYVDEDFDVTHDNDSQGEHGSHVAGIATANRYIKNEDGYSEALTSVLTQGVAPDAQLITMKVFGKDGGAYDSDYMVAIEDAIVLGCDSINLSLGSGNPGLSTNSNYQEILDSLAESSAVVCISAGNSGTWQENTLYGYLYNTDVSMQTDGSPGSYTNAFTVASVTNTGNTGNFLSFGDELPAVSFTESSGYTNKPISTLDTTGEGTTYDFVLFNNTGVDGDGNNLLDAYKDICKDKVVMVYRGTSSFYQKHDAAGAVGGIACIVVNNAAGTINMDLSSSTSTIPCVSITQADGEAVKALDTTAAVTDDNGDVLYYTGKITISSAIQAVQGNPEYYTMSSFSSWGIPGSLELKPEITAPGGNIYSVDGSVEGGEAYENMSGTSMASPQMAGMVAVLAQYIREEGLCDETGLSQRQLAQSLLMSTAEPIIEEREEDAYYYSVLNQGAGLANVNAAITAHSYIVMDDDANGGAADGKVKVELGDDPDCDGVYTFSYTLYNLLDEAATYSLTTNVFTQDVFASYAYDAADVFAYQADDTVEIGYCAQVFLDTWTAELEKAAVTYEVDGEEVKNVTVDGEDSVEITVTIDVTDCDFTYYPNGAYIEAYSYATEQTTNEGETGTVHSIPVLGFYGSWTEPSMYDVGTLADYWYGTESRCPMLYKYTGMYTNYLTIQYAGDNDEYFYFGNPTVNDDEYLEERNAFNSNDTISKYYFSLIRNAGNSKVEITDANTGDVYYSKELGSVYGAYYYSNGSAWYNTTSSVRLDWSGTDLYGDKLPEGTEVNISLIMAPEYYGTGDDTDWEALSDGAYLTTRTAIDNTAPVVDDLFYAETDNSLYARVSENRYLASVALLDSNGELVDYVIPNQALENMGKSAAYTLNPGDVTELYIQVTDYAMNQSTYKVVLSDGELVDDLEAPTSVTLPEALTLVKGTSAKLTPSFEPFLADESVTWRSDDESIATVDENGFVRGVTAGTTTITVTSASTLYGDGETPVSATCEVTVKAYDITITGALQDEDGNPLLFTWDMMNDTTWKKTADIEKNINAITYGNDVELVVGEDENGAPTYDIQYNDDVMYQMNTSGYLYKVDPVTGGTMWSSDSSVAFGAPVQDMEYGYITSQVFGQNVLFGVYGSYFLYSIPAEGNTFSYGWNLSSYLSNYLNASEFTAIAWVGYTQNSADNDVDIFYCLTDTGDIWVMMPDHQTGNASMNFYSTDLDLSFPGYSGTTYCSMVMGDDDNLYLSYFNGETNQIYVLEETAVYDENGDIEDYVFVSTLLGDVGDSVWPAALLTVTVNEHNDDDDDTQKPEEDENPVKKPGETVTPVGPSKPIEDDVPVEPVEPVQPAPSESYIDLDPNAWYIPYIDEMIADGIMTGTSENTFDPSGLMTRGTLVTMLWRMAGSPVVDADTAFTDVANGMYYTEAVRWAASTGIVKGLEETIFAPDVNLTREQLATILFRLAASNGMDVSNAGYTVPDFVDRDQISSWAGEAVCWAYTRGILTGKDGGLLDPTGTATRAEAAAMMVRFRNLSTAEVQ